MRDDRTASMFGDEPAAGGGPGAYQVLARKYRPTRFEELVGQEAMVRTLTNAFKTGRIAHAFMLTGVRGVGKTTTARLLARALNYETKEVHAPSINLAKDGKGEVHGPAIMASQDPDVLELDAASNTGVDSMRDLLNGARYAPVSARYKVYIIDEVHMLSTASFNALLKTLEEPPPHVKFIFATTEIRKVPVTVLSRCQRFNLQRFSTEALIDHLTTICKKEGASAQPEALALIARAAEGSARDALSILDQAIAGRALLTQSGEKILAEDGSVITDEGDITVEQVRDMLGLADRTRILDLLETIIAGDHKAALTETASLLEAGADAPVLLKDLMDAVTEVSRAQALKDAYAYAGPPEWVKRTRAMGEKLSAAQSARMWRLLLQGFEDCARAPDPPAAAQMVVLRLAAAASLPPPEDAMKLMAGGGAVPAPKSQSDSGREPARASADAPVSSVGDLDLPHDEEPHHGVRMSNLREILAELERQRKIELKYDIERYVRPAEIDFGHFNYTAAPGTPRDLSMRIKLWLEATSGVEWTVMQSGDGAPESTAERRQRRGREKLAAAEAHPRIAEALKVFPGAKVLRVEDPQTADEAQDELDDAPARANVIHVDFSGGRAGDDMPPDFDPRSDDEMSYEDRENDD
ncbi:MAG TPA: DNA polymerase III subunit gamma/tau [Hyphomonadaceae bacterium]